MKKTLFFITGILIYVGAHAQVNDTTTHSKKDSSTFHPIDKMPEFPGGLRQLGLYLNKNTRYPYEARRDGIQGRVIVSFIVEPDSSLTDIKVQRSLSPETDAEALRVVTKSPKWIPAMQDGHPVRVRYSIPVSFRLTE